MNTENQEALNPQNEDQNQEQQVPQPENKINQPEVKNLEITGDINVHLTDAGKWASFLSVLGFIFIGLIVMGGFVMSLVFAFIPSSAFGGHSIFPFPMFLIGFLYLIIGAVYFFPILYLFRFSSRIKQALRFKDQEKLSSAFMNLKAHYRFIGIMMIVGLALYAMMFVVMLFAGMAAGFLGTPA
ncbi:DUF5362 family protein [Maribellus sp. YY47]|uniref:DUF5362 family protein n=1 Tax=Maribellus sp. YY47 TaxID=2929486 RepID=UPI002000EB05|nr:DUF5362 family protein [Maribellus sp. YY47]MCK3682996.1 DUF5362 domain-containing protein [Maribellus sp. YY47]